MFESTLKLTRSGVGLKGFSILSVSVLPDRQSDGRIITYGLVNSKVNLVKVGQTILSIDRLTILDTSVCPEYESEVPIRSYDPLKLARNSVDKFYVYVCGQCEHI